MKKEILPYNPRLKKIACTLRNNMTLSEILLWQQIKGKQMCGYDFDRQKPIDEFVVDFYCSELKLAIEIDGASHDFKYEKDCRRQNHLEDLGVRFLRFDDLDIKQNLGAVLIVIEEWITQNS